MRQFDLYQNPSIASQGYAPYLVVLQSHHLEALDSVVLAPVIRDAERPLSPIDVEVEIEGERLILAISELASVHRSMLKGRAGSGQAYEDAIRRALDRLFTGF